MDGWADGPTECTFILAQDFRSAMWENRMPNPDYREFISTCDMAPAFQHHRRVLQILQSQTTGTWCLKMPAHALYIDTVLATYPDARIIWTHRDPATATASFLNLAAFAHGLTLGEPDLDWIAETYPPRLVEQAARPLAALAGRDVFHLHYADMQRDPLAQMDELYRWLDADLTEATRQAMLDWLDAETFHATRGLSSGLDRFGLDRAAVLETFSDYRRAFPIELDDAG